MCQPKIVEVRIGRDKRLVDPRLFAIGTTAHYGLKLGIHAHFIDALANRSTQRTRNVQVVMLQDSARVRRVPANCAIVICHGEDAMGVGVDYQYWIKWLKRSFWHGYYVQMFLYIGREHM